MDIRLMNSSNLYNETFSDEFLSSEDSSEEEEEEDDEEDNDGRRKHNKCDNSFNRKTSCKGPMDTETKSYSKCDKTENSPNLVLKLINRERTGYFTGCYKNKQNERAFNEVPRRLSFCLKDIVPYCYLQGHMFMGLTVCGQFLISYKVYYDENSVVSDYNFSTYYKYTLYFWIYRPHQPLGRYFKTCLFDDHGVDNLKSVTMTQWVNHSNILIIHGASEYENEDSYLTIVRVPKLGCSECKELRSIDGDGYYRCDALCIKCNLTIHTKYSTAESDPRFNPYANLLCPERIILIGNGFIHMLHVDLEVQKQQSLQHNQLSHKHQQILDVTKEDKTALTSTTADTKSNLSNFASTSTVISAGSAATGDTGCDNKNNIVARIMADFSEDFNEIQNSNDKAVRLTDTKSKNYDELIFTCGLSNSSGDPGGSCSNNISKTTSHSNRPAKVSILNHQGKKNHRIVTKSYRNGVTTIEMQPIHVGSSNTSSTSNETGNNSNHNSTTSNNDKASAYEFSEENEKCEKIGTFRKRRLADKKYEFHEDNAENIIPYTKTRLSSSQSKITSRIHSNGYKSLNSLTTGNSVKCITTLVTSSTLITPTTGPAMTTSTASSNMHIREHSSEPSSNFYFSRCHSSSSQSFRSPCGSPNGGYVGRHLKSPTTASNSAGIVISGGSSSNNIGNSNVRGTGLLEFGGQELQNQENVKPSNTLSPRQFSGLTAGRRNYNELPYIGNMSPTSPFLSPRRDDGYFSIMMNIGNDINQEKPACTKKFKRRFVEEDDAASVITSEEDDCISPGYHTSLPMEVHGSCYSDMQMISRTSYQKLKCPTVIVTQHSFDLETFTYYVISNLCQMNNKTYDVFYDWACELVNVCPNNISITSILMAHFTARDQLSSTTKKCLNCSRSLDCVFHRKQFECRILFTWNMDTGDWDVLDYGQLNEVPSSINSSNRPTSSLSSPSSSSSASSCNGNGNSSSGGGLNKIAKDLANEINSNLLLKYDYTFNLRVLDSNIDKSKTNLTDLDNLIEFYRKRPRLPSYD